MWASRYWADRYWAPRYWAKVGAADTNAALQGRLVSYPLWMTSVTTNAVLAWLLLWRR